MIRRNTDVLPASREILPNGFYEAYGHLLDEILLERTFEPDVLKDLYIFDRYEPTREPFVPREWQRISFIQNPELEHEFTIQRDFGHQERELLSFLLTNMQNGKLLGIVGDVGTGKSTFVRYMFRHYLPAQPFGRDARIWVVDVSRVFQTKEKYTYDETVAAVLPELREVLKKTDASPEDAGPWTGYQFVEFVRAEIERLADRRKVIIVIDNVDRFSTSFQMHLAELCDRLVDTTGCTVVVALRPVTIPHFTLATRAPGTPTRYLAQRPPIVEKVLQRRLEYLVRAREDFRTPRRIRVASQDVFVEFAGVERVVLNFVKLVLEQRVREALEHLTNRNVRLALVWARDLLCSWNLDVRDLLYRSEARTPSPWRSKAPEELDTFITALGYCNHDMYFRSTSRLENLFSANLPGRHDTLIKYRCLTYCEHQTGALPKDALRKHLSRFGYEDDEIALAVDQLLESPRRLLQSIDGNTLAELKTLGITPAGRWFLQKILRYMRYVQIVADDMLLPEEMALNVGTWNDRMIKLLRVLQFIGERELEEAKDYTRSSDDHEPLAKEYEEVYGEIPLAVRLMNSQRSIVVGHSGGPGSHFSSAEKRSLEDQIADAAQTLTDKFNREVFARAR